MNDIATLKQQVANITPDDSSIGDKPWSSKHIIDMLCPPLEESGSATVTGRADPIKRITDLEDAVASQT